MSQIRRRLNQIVAALELTRGGASQNLRPMEGLRGVAVLMVFLVHYATAVFNLGGLGASGQRALGLIHQVGNAGVDLFFVLSGYLIYGLVISRDTPYSTFLWRRAVRLYPTFLAVLLLYIALSIAMPSRSKLPADPMEAAVYLAQNLLFLPGLLPIEPIITVAWSLSYEWFFYLTVPLAVALLRLRSWRAEYRLLLLVVMGLAAAYWASRSGGHVRLIMFLGGMCVFEGMKLSAGKGVAASIGWGAVAASAAVLGRDWPGDAMQALKFLVLCVAFSLVCLHAFGSSSGWMARALSWAPLRWLGNASYSYYLIHGLTINAFFLVISKLFALQGSAVTALALLVPTLALTLGTALTLFLLVERPLSLSPAEQPGSKNNAEARPIKRTAAH